MDGTSNKHAVWLVASVLCTAATIVALIYLGYRPIDEESPLENANLALVAILCGGLIASAFAAVSLLKRESLRHATVAWFLVNLIGAVGAPVTLRIFSAIFYIK